ncbi:hypothetical protein DVR12_22880 [Chitinophaga silvatica]|uniref:Uncharacterized protein n=1 Tax=Chitinophaga silvatica TaxID=2282649 RepID=A0A3E1Y4C9_9BACT|nr:hypothetical protein [Chitinophaga silvatica]RFS19482.1 hypothetical protein DVR12_22880 [Chitinophaga silvatica]
MKQSILLLLFLLQSTFLLAKSPVKEFTRITDDTIPDFVSRELNYDANAKWLKYNGKYYFNYSQENNITITGMPENAVPTILKGLSIVHKIGNGHSEDSIIPIPEVGRHGAVFKEGKFAIQLSSIISAANLKENDQFEVSLINPNKTDEGFKATFIYRTKPKVETTPKTENTNCDLVAPYFIPTAQTENYWRSQGQIGTGQHPHPILEKQTGWALVYNYSNVDPVAAYKRVWGKVNTGSVAIPMAKGNTSNSISGLTNVEDKNELNEKVNSKVQELEKEKIKVTEKYMVAGHTSKARKEAVKELGKIDESISFLKSISNPAYSAAPTSYLPYNVVPPFSNAKHVKHFAPTVSRDLLISVSNFHPYRDSFSLAISYNDNFMDQAQLFTSTFAGLLGNNASSEASKTDDKDKKTTLQSAKVSECSPLEKFTVLRNDLKTYYMQKFKTEQLKLEEIERGLSFIRLRMADSVLKISNASEQAIIKRGQDLLDEQKTYTASLSAYLDMVNDAAYWFGKISHYSFFDTRKIRIRNQDEINITLNKYRDGVLVTPQYEALRTYKTSGGFKLDFSVGLFGSALMDLSYAAVTTPYIDTIRFRDPSGAVRTDTMGIDSTNRYKITKDGKGNFNIGPAVLMHFYWRTGIDINVGGTVGLSINQSGQPRYLLGGSLLLGRDSRWVISYGGAFGTVKALGTGLNEGDLVKSDKLNNNQVPLIDKWSSSWFFSVSFNFAGFSLGSNK